MADRLTTLAKKIAPLVKRMIVEANYDSPPQISVVAGDGISVSGIVVGVDTTVVRTTRQVVAGNGLTGGGALAADLTLAVGAGDGIDVAADTVAVDVTDFIDTAAGLKEDASNNIQVNLGTGLTFSAGAIVLNYSGNPGTIQPDAAAAGGSSAYAARLDHTHAIVCAAPGANSVSLAASAEGTGTSFARNDHTHSLDQSISPTWSGSHVFSNPVRVPILHNADDFDNSIYTGMWDGTTIRGAFQTIYGRDFSGAEGMIDIIGDIRNAAAAAGSIRFLQYDGSWYTRLVIDKAGNLVGSQDAQIAGGLYVGATGTDPDAGTITAYRSGANATITATRASGAEMVLIGGASAGVVGTASNHPFYVYTNNTAKATVTAGGNILLGTSTDGMTAAGSLAIAQDLAHRGTKVGFYNVTPVTRQTQLVPTKTGNNTTDIDNLFTWVQGIQDKLTALGLIQ